MSSTHFDWKFYTNFYADIKAANINTEDKALEHFTIHGSVENRKSSLDVDKYLKNGENYGESLYCSINNDSLSGLNRSILQYLIKDCKLSSQAKVLEIGCGIACVSLPLIKHLKSGQYCGLDTDKQSIDWCKRKIAPYCDGKFTVMSDDGELRLPYDDNEFDLVLSASLLCNQPPENVDKYLSEINRVLKKGGQFMFTVFMTHQFQTTCTAKTLKTRLIKVNGATMITNHRNEKAYVHSDELITTCLEHQHFEIKDTLFGNWSNMSNSPIYQDLINTVKLR